MAGKVRISRMRHLRHRRLRGIDRGAAGATKNIPRLKRLEAWLSQQATRLTASATGTTFTAVAGAVATSILTLSVAVPTPGETVTIDGRVYTFVSSFGPNPNQVLIGTTMPLTLLNLLAAINADPAGVGSQYSIGTTAHPTVSASVGGGNTMNIAARAEGTAGNSIATTETLTNGSWTGGTMASGVNQACTATTHGFAQNEGPYYITTSGTIPAGLAALRKYWIAVIDANTFNLRAQPNGPVVNITSAGAPTNTLTKVIANPRDFASLLRRNKPRTVQGIADIDSLA